MIQYVGPEVYRCLLLSPSVTCHTTIQLGSEVDKWAEQSVENVPCCYERLAFI